MPPIQPGLTDRRTFVFFFGPERDSIYSRRLPSTGSALSLNGWKSVQQLLVRAPSFHDALILLFEGDFGCLRRETLRLRYKHVNRFLVLTLGLKRWRCAAEEIVQLQGHA